MTSLSDFQALEKVAARLGLADEIAGVGAKARYFGVGQWIVVEAANDRIQIRYERGCQSSTRTFRERKDGTWNIDGIVGAVNALRSTLAKKLTRERGLA